MKAILEKNKKSTDIVSSYLEFTVRQHGCPVQVLNLAEVDTDKGRLKGKARKTAQQNEGLNVEKTSNKKQRLAVKNFLAIAEFISAVPNLKVPRYFERAISSAIDLRERFSKMVDQAVHSPYLIEEKNLKDSTHQHFTSQLRGVQEI